MRFSIKTLESDGVNAVGSAVQIIRTRETKRDTIASVIGVDVEVEQEQKTLDVSFDKNLRISIDGGAPVQLYAIDRFTLADSKDKATASIVFETTKKAGMPHILIVKDIDD